MPPAENVPVNTLMQRGAAEFRREAKQHPERAEQLLKSSLDSLGRARENTVSSYCSEQMLETEQKSGADGFRAVQNSELEKILKHVQGYHNIVINDTNLELIEQTGFASQLDALQMKSIPEVSKVIDEIEERVFGEGQRSPRLRARDKLRDLRRNFEQTVNEFFRARERIDEIRQRISAGRNILDPDRDDVAAAELAVDGEVEKRQIAFAVFHLKPGANGPDLAWPQRRLRADELAFVPGLRMRPGFRGGIGIFHRLSPWLKDRPACAYLTTSTTGFGGKLPDTPTDPAVKAVCGRPSVGKDFLKFLHSAGWCGHVSGLFCGLSICRWP